MRQIHQRLTFEFVQYPILLFCFVLLLLLEGVGGREGGSSPQLITSNVCVGSPVCVLGVEDGV